MPTPPHPSARSITISGKLALKLAKTREEVTIPFTELRPGQRFQAGPHSVTLRNILQRGGAIYEFDSAQNPLIDSITFLDREGQPLRDQHSTKYKDPATWQYRLLDQRRPAALRITYLPDPEPRTIPFNVTATLGL